MLLQPEGVAFDTVDYDAGNLAIAFYTVIENAIGTDHDDILIGNAWNNTLDGGKGNDILYGDGVVYDGNAGFRQEDVQRGWNDTTNKKPAGNDSGDDWLIGGLGKAIGEYRELLDVTFHHPMMREHYRADEEIWMLRKDLPHMLIRVLERSAMNDT